MRLRIEDVERREGRLGADAVPEVDSESQVARPERVAQLSVPARVRLQDAVHREGARAIQPAGVAGALVELEEGVPVSAGAVAQVRAFTKRPGRPDRLSRGQKELVERMAGEFGKTDDEAGRAVAE